MTHRNEQRRAEIRTLKAKVSRLIHQLVGRGVKSTAIASAADVHPTLLTRLKKDNGVEASIRIERLRPLPQTLTRMLMERTRELLQDLLPDLLLPLDFKNDERIPPSPEVRKELAHSLTRFLLQAADSENAAPRLDLPAGVHGFVCQIGDHRSIRDDRSLVFLAAGDTQEALLHELEHICGRLRAQLPAPVANVTPPKPLY